MRECACVHAHVCTCMWRLSPKGVCVSVEACAEATRIPARDCLHSALASGCCCFVFQVWGSLVWFLSPFPLLSPPSPSLLLPKGFRRASDNLTLKSNCAHRECSNFILLHVAVQFSQHHLLKRLSFLHCISLPPLS